MNSAEKRETKQRPAPKSVEALSGKSMYETLGNGHNGKALFHILIRRPQGLCAGQNEAKLGIMRIN